MAKVSAVVAFASHEHDADTLEGVWQAPFGVASSATVVEGGSDFRVPHSERNSASRLFVAGRLDCTGWREAENCGSRNGARQTCAVKEKGKNANGKGTRKERVLSFPVQGKFRVRL